MRDLIRIAVPLLLAMGLTGCLSSDPVTDSHSVHRVSPARNASNTNRPSYGETYVVTRGDTLYSIAFRNQLDYHELADWNGIGRDYAIRVGQVLRLTAPGSPGLPPPVAKADHTASAAKPAAGSSGSAAQVAPAAKTDATISVPAAVPRSGSLATGTWEWPTHGNLLRAFDGSSNKGIDIGGEPGQIIVASRAGKVVYSGSALKGYGELVIIKHDEDTLSAYGYNRKRLVEEGDSVAGGQPIAELGLGPENKPLLHFEIRDHGRPVDPRQLLPAR